MWLYLIGTVTKVAFTVYLRKKCAVNDFLACTLVWYVSKIEELYKKGSGLQRLKKKKKRWYREMSHPLPYSRPVSEYICETHQEKVYQLHQIHQFLSYLHQWLYLQGRGVWWARRQCRSYSSHQISTQLPLTPLKKKFIHPTLCFVAWGAATTNDLTIHPELFLLCLRQPQGLLGEMEEVERVEAGAEGKELSFAICSLSFLPPTI